MKNEARVLVDEIRQTLAANASAVDAEAMQRYMKSAMPFRGVRMVQTRAITKRLATEHSLADESTWRFAIRDLWDSAEFREERYSAIELAADRTGRRFQTPGVLALYRHMIVTGAWWDLVDPIASRLVGPILKSHHADVSPLIRDWTEADDMWLRRTAIICQLQTKADTDVDLLSLAIEQNLLGSRFGDEFFIRKAIGWALRQHARIDADWVVDFVRSHEAALSSLSTREALKHLG